MVSINSLKNRYLKATGGNNSGIFYTIKQVTDADRGLYPGQELYVTPDACLQAVYEHARAHHYRQIKVGMFALFYETNQNDVIGYVMELGRGVLTASDDSTKDSFMWIIENGFGGGEKVKLHYPEEKPELEILNYLWFNADQWCKGNGYADLEAFNEQRRERHMNDRRNYPGEYVDEEVLILKWQYAEAGYDLSRLGEVQYTDGGELYVTLEQADAMRSADGA